MVKEIRYHRFCMTEYQNSARNTPKGVEQEINRKEPAETTDIERKKCFHKLLKASKNLF